VKSNGELEWNLDKDLNYTFNTEANYGNNGLEDLVEGDHIFESGRNQRLVPKKLEETKSN